jgi:hypothetical protein
LLNASPAIRLPRYISPPIIQVIEGGGVIDQMTRIKDFSDFSRLVLDGTSTISVIWKKNNPNPGLGIFLKHVCELRWQMKRLQNNRF